MHAQVALQRIGNNRQALWPGATLRSPPGKGETLLTSVRSGRIDTACLLSRVVSDRAAAEVEAILGFGGVPKSIPNELAAISSIRGYHSARGDFRASR
jgi:hypothetical protein